MKVQYQLKHDKSRKKSAIVLQCSLDGKPLQYHVGISIEPKGWNQKGHKLYSGAKDSETINIYLEKIRRAATDEYYNCKDKKKPFNLEYLKQFLDERFKTDKAKPQFLDEYVIEYIKDRVKKVNDRTNAKFKTFYNHLTDIQDYYKKRLTYEMLNRDFYTNYIDYFIFIKKHENRTIKDKHCENLKTFINWSVNKGYIEKNPYKGIKFPYKINPADTISLSDSEIHNLYNLDLNNAALERAKDIFCLECFCGLRYSDTNKILPENLKGNHLEIFPEKGDKKLYIPLRPEALKLIHKYFDQNHEFPHLSNQNLNDYLKIICKEAGFNDSVSILSISGNKKETKVFKKFELVSTHTARRTFVTLSVERGMNFLDIMSITGHTKLETFMKYYRPGQSKISENFFNAYAKIKPAYSITEIVSNLVKSEVDKKVIAEAFGIEIENIN